MEGVLIMFRIIGSDGKEYGPASSEEIRTWFSQGRLNAGSRIKPEGAPDYKTLGEMSEFSDLVQTAPAAAPPPLSPPQPTSNTAALSGMAVASLVLGILGFFSLGLAAIPGVILGIVALVKIQKEPAQLKGAGLAIAGICVSGTMLLFVPVMAAMLLPALGKAKQRAQAIQCMNNIRQIDLALIMYADDHGGKLPPADGWNDALKPYTGGSDVMFHCPAQPPGRCSYALNAALAGQQMPDSGKAKLVLVFSSNEGWNQSGTTQSAVPHRHQRTFITAGFADGHAEVVRADRFKSAQ